MFVFLEEYFGNFENTIGDEECGENVYGVVQMSEENNYRKED